jgi:hypothetical protein
MLPVNELVLSNSVKVTSPKQEMLKTGDLRCFYTDFVFGQAVVDAYNQHTEAFNEALSYSEQSLLLNGRNEFIDGVMLRCLKEAQRYRGIH